MISAYTMHNEILDKHPDYLERLYQEFHWDRPMYQTMPDDPTQTAVMPIFEIKDDGLVITTNRITWQREWSVPARR